MMRSLTTLAFAAFVSIGAVAPTAAQSIPFELDIVAEGLEQPVFATAPAGDARLFLVEQPGTIRILANGDVADEPFLDIAGRVRAGGERGLLGLAFHPDYASNGRFFINYTDRNGDTQVVELSVSTDPDFADPGSARILLSVDQPYGNHNGGWIAFGPDGLLYVALGDGGSGGDPRGYGQNEGALLGKILRLDVDAGGEPEIFVSGVRNPWRNAFDGNNLYVADVGQSEWEEISLIGLEDAGANLGWNIMEGFDCFTTADCDQSGLTLPIHVYSHDAGCSITGGYVYRGAAIPAIVGRYFFADYCSGEMWSLRYDNGVEDVTSYAEALGSIGPVTSFGLDSAGEMYLMTQDGNLMQFVPR